MAVFFSDTFTQGSAGALTSHTSDSGGSWLHWGGNATSPQVYTTLGGVVGSGSTAIQVYRASVISPAADCDTQGTAYFGGTVCYAVGVCARLDAAGNSGYAAVYNATSTTAGQWILYRIDAGMSFVSLATIAGPQLANTNTPAIKLTVTGSGASVSLVLNVNASDILSYSDTSASRVTAAGYAGVIFSTQSGAGTAMFFNTFTASDVASSTVTGVTVSPSTATVTGGATQAFTATVAGTGSPSQSVTWSTSAGSITVGGVLTAPTATGSVQTVTVTATSVQDGAYAGTSTVTVPVAVTASITAPVTGKIYPLSSGTTGTASIPFSGTYSGTAPDEWRLVLDSDGTTAVAVTGGSGWQSFASAPAAGAFSQTIGGVPKLAGWYRIQTRNSGTPGTIYESGKVGAGVLIVVDGQSQAWLWFSPTAYAGDSTLTPNTLLRVAGKQSATVNSSWDVPNTATMNGAIACGNALVTALGCPVGLIDGSWDATYLIGDWISGGAAGAAYTSSAAAITALTTSVLATIWIQGEGDAGAGYTQAAYYTALGQLFALRRGATTSTHPYIVATLARNLAGMADANREAIKAAQVQACADADVYRVDRHDLPLHSDGVHHTAAGFKTLGERCAQAVLAALGIVSTYRGPRIASIAQTATPAVFDVTLTHEMGTDFTPTSGITGFRVLVSGSPVTISSVARQAANKVRITLAATPGSMPTVQYLYGSTPDITGVAKDNGTLTLPLEYNGGVLAAAYVAVRCTLTLTTNGSTPAASQTGIVWAWYDAAPPSLSALPAVTGTGATTDASGVFDVALTGTTLTSGQTGTLLALISNGTAGSSSNKAFCAPVAVA